MTLEAKIEELKGLVKKNGEGLQAISDVLMNNTVTAADAAKYLGYSYRHFIVEIRDEIPYEKVGRNYMFRLRDLEAWKQKYIA